MQQTRNAEMAKKTDSKDKPKNKTAGLDAVPLNIKNKGRYNDVISGERSWVVKVVSTCLECLQDFGQNRSYRRQVGFFGADAQGFRLFKLFGKRGLCLIFFSYWRHCALQNIF